MSKAPPPDPADRHEHEPQPVERRDFPPGALVLAALVVAALVWWLVGEG